MYETVKDFFKGVKNKPVDAFIYWRKYRKHLIIKKKNSRAPI